MFKAEGEKRRAFCPYRQWRYAYPISRYAPRDAAATSGRSGGAAKTRGSDQSRHGTAVPVRQIQF